MQEQLFLFSWNFINFVFSLYKKRYEVKREIFKDIELIYTENLTKEL